MQNFNLSSGAQSDGLPSGTIIGNPYQDILQWDGRQTAADDCVVRSEQFIIEQYTGQKLSETDLEREAQSHGWYHPGNGGTPVDDMSKLLQAHGVGADSYSHATISQLADQLQQGHKVIAAVNAEDLWQHDPALQGQIQQGSSQAADHAVVVSGIDTTDPSHPRVLISDPGTGEALASYSLTDFMAAWDTSGDTMVATTTAEQNSGTTAASQPSTTVAPVRDQRANQDTPPANESPAGPPADHTSSNPDSLPSEVPTLHPADPYSEPQVTLFEPAFVEVFAVPVFAEPAMDSPSVQLEYFQEDAQWFAEYPTAELYVTSDATFEQTSW